MPTLYELLGGMEFATLYYDNLDYNMHPFGA